MLTSLCFTFARCSLINLEGCLFAFQAEERLKLLKEKAQIDEERRKLKEEKEEWNKSEQRVILNKGNATRPRLSFALKPS